jgi:hypothetical protein
MYGARDPECQLAARVLQMPVNRTVTLASSYVDSRSFLIKLDIELRYITSDTEYQPNHAAPLLLQ